MGASELFEGPSWHPGATRESRFPLICSPSSSRIPVGDAESRLQRFLALCGGFPDFSYQHRFLADNSLLSSGKASHFLVPVVPSVVWTWLLTIHSVSGRGLLDVDAREAPTPADLTHLVIDLGAATGDVVVGVLLPGKELLLLEDLILVTDKEANVASK
jgi:hypothetical protein